MATIQYGSALPAADLVPRIPVANPSLPKPSIGHGPVSIPSALPTPVQRRDGSITKRHPGIIQSPEAGTVQLPEINGGGEGPGVDTLERRAVPICPLGTSPSGKFGECVEPSPIPIPTAPTCPFGSSIPGCVQPTGVPIVPLE